MVITDTLVAALLILLAPAAGAVFCLLFGRGQTPAWVATAALFLSWCAALLVFSQVANGEIVDEDLFVWLRLGDLSLKAGVLVDGITAFMLVVSTTLAFAIQLFSVGTRKSDDSGSRFYALVCLTSAAMVLLLIANGFGGLYCGWVLLGLCGYFLAVWGRVRRQSDIRSSSLTDEPDSNAATGAAFAFWMVDRVGDAMFFVSLLLFAATDGTLHYSGLGTTTNGQAQLAVLLLAIAALTRMAQFPMHIWLVDATRAPASTNALVHFGFMSMAAVYALVRAGGLLEALVGLRWAILAIGLFTALFAALIALGERDLKKVLAFSSSSQLGLIVAMVGVGAHAIAVFCVCMHGIHKALLFLATSVLSTRSGHGLDVWNLQQRFNRLLIPFWAFIIGATGLSGLPPTAAIWTTGATLSALYRSGGIELWVTGCVAVLLTALYSFRFLLLIYTRSAATFRDDRPKPLTHHASAALVLLSVSSVGAAGLPLLISPQFLFEMIQPTAMMGAVNNAGFPHEAYWSAPVAIALFGLGIAWMLFGFKTGPSAKENLLQRWSRNHFYVEAVVRYAVVRPLNWVAAFLRDAIDTIVLDLGFICGSAMFVRGVGWLLSATQSGRIGLYATVATAGLVVVTYFLIAF